MALQMTLCNAVVVGRWSSQKTVRAVLWLRLRFYDDGHVEGGRLCSPMPKWKGCSDHPISYPPSLHLRSSCVDISSPGSEHDFCDQASPSFASKHTSVWHHNRCLGVSLCIQLVKSRGMGWQWQCRRSQKGRSRSLGYLRLASSQVVSVSVHVNKTPLLMIYGLKACRRCTYGTISEVIWFVAKGIR